MVEKKLILLVLLTAIVSLGILLTPYENSTARYLFTCVGIFFVIIVSTWIGIDGARFFGFKSAYGMAMLLISLGIFSWGIGNMIFFYYNVFENTEVPYPSLADVGYLGLIPLANYGLFIILKNIKINFDAMTIIKIIIPPIIFSAIIFPIFIYGKLGEDTTLLLKALNIIYPLGDIIFLSLAVIIMHLTYKSILFKPLFILGIGFILQAIADFSFSYTTAAGIYYTGYWTDTFFCLAFFAIGVGLYYIHHSHSDLISKKGDAAK